MSSTELKKAGLKVTLPRKRILDIFKANASRHLSADDIFRYLLDANEEIGMATVYRVLTQSEQAGLLKRRNFEGAQSVFELDCGDHHDHIVCVRCGRNQLCIIQ